MHARIDQLLRLRDREPLDADARAHVESCPECRAELERLLDVQARLRALPPVASQPAGWPSLEARMARQARVGARRARVFRVAAVASVVVLTAFAGIELVGRIGTPVGSAPPAAVEAVAEAEPIDRLREESLALEQLLASLPERPAVERADVALPIDALQAQVQWLDHQLSVADVEGVAASGKEALWRERVEAMDTLVRLRYVEAQRTVL